MKNYIILIMFTVSFFSCENANDKIGLNENLYKVIFNYQEKYPFPEKFKSEFILSYSVDFWKEKEDTLVRILRTSIGRTNSDKKFGIYKDDNLKPTIIMDNKDLGNKFILKKIKLKADIKLETTTERFPPIYIYLVDNRELKLIKIDTVWKDWD